MVLASQSPNTWLLWEFRFSLVFFQLVFVETKDVFCRDENMLAATKGSSRQNYVCRDKIMFVATKICLSLQASSLCYQ